MYIVTNRFNTLPWKVYFFKSPAFKFLTISYLTQAMCKKYKLKNIKISTSLELSLKLLNLGIYYVIRTVVEHPVFAMFSIESKMLT